MKDFQRGKVYKWEQEEFGWDKEEMTLIELQLLINKIVPNVVIKDGRGRKRGAAYYLQREIHLPRRTRVKWYLLHEAAHFLGRDQHGPLFVSKYLQLLSQYYNRDIDQLKDSLQDKGIKFSD